MSVHLKTVSFTLIAGALTTLGFVCVNKPPVKPADAVHGSTGTAQILLSGTASDRNVSDLPANTGKWNTGTPYMVSPSSNRVPPSEKKTVTAGPARQRPLKDCGDGDCDAGENSNVCAIDCGSNHAKAYEFSLRLFQARFGGREPGIRPVLPRTPEFVLGNPYGKLKHFEYIFLVVAIHYEVPISHPYVEKYVVALSKSRIRQIYADRWVRLGYKKAPVYLLQKEDIQEIHRQLFPSEPALKYGVKLNSGGSYMFRAGKLIPDSPLKDYQNGKTIVYPATTFGPDRPILNLNTPAVREYWVRVGLKAARASMSNAIYIDSGTSSYNHFYQKRPRAKYYYISPGDESEQSRRYVAHAMGAVAEMKRRNKDMSIILNNLYPHCDLPYRIAANEVILSDEYLPHIDGLSIDNMFRPREVQWHLDTIRKAKKTNTMILYLRNKQTEQKSSYVYRLWLWYHLIADDNTYFYINDKYANKKMVKYHIYDYPLGHAQEKPHKEGNVWVRKYERGSIFYNIELDDLDGIYFVENKE